MEKESLVPIFKQTEEQQQWTKAYAKRLKIGKFLKAKLESQMQAATATRGELGFLEESLNELIGSAPEQMVKEIAGQDTTVLRDNLINLIRKPEGVSLGY